MPPRLKTVQESRTHLPARWWAVRRQWPFMDGRYMTIIWLNVLDVGRLQAARDNTVIKMLRCHPLPNHPFPLPPTSSRGIRAWGSWIFISVSHQHWDHHWTTVNYCELLWTSVGTTSGKKSVKGGASKHSSWMRMKRNHRRISTWSLIRLKLLKKKCRYFFSSLNIFFYLYLQSVCQHNL